MTAKKELLEKGLSPKKSFGQNFMMDQRYNLAIVDAIGAAPVTIIELGAGTGSLTEQLLKHYPHVIAVERDRDLVPILQEKFATEIASGHLLVREENAAKLDITSLLMAEQSAVLVGNLPYHLTSSIFFLALEHWHRLTRLVFLIQEEVADRIAAKPNCKTYGFLSVALGIGYTIEKTGRVPRSAFWPVPRVDSAIVCLTKTDLGLGALDDPKHFFTFVKMCFQKRRKKLSTILGRTKECSINLDLRPENLTPPQFLQLYKEMGP